MNDRGQQTERNQIDEPDETDHERTENVGEFLAEIEDKRQDQGKNQRLNQKFDGVDLADVVEVAALAEDK
jgi:gas vesicle GvpC-like protein